MLGVKDRLEKVLNCDLKADKVQPCRPETKRAIVPDGQMKKEEPKKKGVGWGGDVIEILVSVRNTKDAIISRGAESA